MVHMPARVGTSRRARMSAWAEQGWPVWAYFNNDIGGHAVRDAERLRSFLQRRGVRMNTLARACSPGGTRLANGRA
ncbi:MAG: DUF72 domain-containing protein [Chloroflexi bacterium]|nr:DUF72 domain-containing protein [Chloroflexota bacterium]